MFRKPLLPGLIWTILIALLTLIPGNYIPKVTTFFNWLGPDKLVHLFIFGVYAYLLVEGLHRQTLVVITHEKALLSSLLLGMVFATFTEVMQRFVIPGRNGNYFDFLADLLGLALGSMIWSIIRRNDKKNLSESKKYN